VLIGFEKRVQVKLADEPVLIEIVYVKGHLEEHFFAIVNVVFNCVYKLPKIVVSIKVKELHYSLGYIPLVSLA